MTKELELEIYDIVKIVDGNGSICLESINEIHNDENGKLAFTDNFVIDLKKDECDCVSDGNPYQLEMVWRLDGNRNYTMIYPIQRLESIDNAKINRDITANYVSFHQDNSNSSKELKELNDLTDYLLRDGINISSTSSYPFIKQALQRLDEYEQILGNGRLTDRNYKNTTLALDSCKPYLRLGQLEDIYEESKRCK